MKKKPIDMAIDIIEGRATFHPSLLKEDSAPDLWETYKNLCAYNDHEPASSEIAYFERKTD